MSIYATVFDTPANHVANTPFFEIFAGPTASIKVLEIGFSRTGATPLNADVGIGRPSIKGTPQSYYTYSFIPEENVADPSAQAYAATAWNVSPVDSTLYLRKFNYGRGSGNCAAFIWTFARSGLHIAPNGSVVIWTFALVGSSGNAPAIWIVIDE